MQEYLNYTNFFQGSKFLLYMMEVFKPVWHFSLKFRQFFCMALCIEGIVKQDFRPFLINPLQRTSTTKLKILTQLIEGNRLTGLNSRLEQNVVLLLKVANRFIPDNLDMFVLDRTGPGFISTIVVSIHDFQKLSIKHNLFRVCNKIYLVVKNNLNVKLLQHSIHIKS